MKKVFGWSAIGMLVLGTLFVSGAFSRAEAQTESALKPQSYEEAVAAGEEARAREASQPQSYEEAVIAGEEARAREAAQPQSYDEAVAQNEATREQEAQRTAQARAEADQDSGGAKEKDGNCLDFGGLHMEACIAKISNIVLQIMAFFVWVAGSLLEISLNFTLNISKFKSQIAVVDIGWKIFRDLSNIVFIFLLLWIGISTILGLNSGHTKKLLINLILIALLINFSLFITGAIIDASNIIALHFWNLITSDGQHSVSSLFMEGLRMQTLYDSTNAPSALRKIADYAAVVPNPLSGAVRGAQATIAILNDPKVIIISVFGSILMLVTAYVFFAAAVLFLIRTVTLLFLMMLSPLAFIAMILPGLQGLAHDWWSKLWTQCIFAPAYLVLTYIVISAIQNKAFQEILTIRVASDFIDAGAGAAVVAFLFLIMMMIGSLLIANHLGAKGASTLIGWGKGAAFGLGGFVAGGMARGSIGRAARWADEHLEHSKFGSTYVGSAIRGLTTEKLAHAKFGTKRSAEDEFRERLKRKSDYSSKENRDEVLENISILKSERAKNPNFDDKEIKRKIQGGMIRMTTENIERLPREVLNNPEIMQYATTAQMDAVMKSKLYTDDEKRGFAKAKYGKFFQLSDTAKKYNAVKDQIAEDQRDHPGAPPNIALAEKAAKLEKELGEIGSEIYDRVRGLTNKEIDLMNWIDPSVFDPPQFTGMLRYSRIGDIRSSESFDDDRKQELRLIKDYRIYEAITRVFGFDNLPGKTDIQHWTNKFNELKTKMADPSVSAEEKTKLEPLFKLYEKLASVSPTISAEGWKKMKESDGGIMDMMRKKDFARFSHDQYMKDYGEHYATAHGGGTAGAQAWLKEKSVAEQNLSKQLGERSPDEVMRSRGFLWNQVPVLRQIGRTVLNTTVFLGKDTKELAFTVENKTQAWLKHKKFIETNGAEGSEMSEADRSAQEYFTIDEKGMNTVPENLLDNEIDLLSDTAGAQVKIKLGLQPTEKMTAKKAFELMRTEYERSPRATNRRGGRGGTPPTPPAGAQPPTPPPPTPPTPPKIIPGGRPNPPRPGTSRKFGP